jgi:hypothetical protein
MVFPSAKTYINGHNKRPNGEPLVPSPSMNHDPDKRATLDEPKFQHHTNPYYNNITTTTLKLGHPAVKRQFFQHCIILLKSPKERITGQKSMDHTCSMIQMIETMKGIFWSVKKW